MMAKRTIDDGANSENSSNKNNNKNGKIMMSMKTTGARLMIGTVTTTTVMEMTMTMSRRPLLKHKFPVHLARFKMKLK